MSWQGVGTGMPFMEVSASSSWVYLESSSLEVVHAILNATRGVSSFSHSCIRVGSALQEELPQTTKLSKIELGRTSCASGSPLRLLHVGQQQLDTPDSAFFFWFVLKFPSRLRHALTLNPVSLHLFIDCLSLLAALTDDLLLPPESSSSAD